MTLDEFKPTHETREMGYPLCPLMWTGGEIWGLNGEGAPTRLYFFRDGDWWIDAGRASVRITGLGGLGIRKIAPAA